MAKAKPFRKNNRTIIAAIIAGIVFVMFGMAFASVPLYRMFCAATGYGGTPQIVKTASLQHGTRTLAVRFDANVAPGLPWTFVPETNSISLRTGETATIFFKAVNLSDKPLTAQALFNVTPENSGAFFDKISCFCFTEQKLDAHESVDFPVVFYLDPALEQDEGMRQVDQITLSYTFFASKNPSALADSGKTRDTDKAPERKPL